jgi:fused signal recognition particle receptor
MMKKKSLGVRLSGLFNRNQFDESFFEEFEDSLIEADLGASMAMEVSDELRERIKKESVKYTEDALSILKNIILRELHTDHLDIKPGSINVFLVLGVNGVGKTTSIAKLAHYYREKTGEDVVLAAGDTFRAAAADQLELWGDRMNMRVVRQNPGSDPGAVIFDAVTSAKARDERIVLADTAGRMHNRADLVKELTKIDKIVRTKLEVPNYRKILVIDATTGQNGLRQAEIFHEAVGVDGIVLAKYDSTAKGGIAVSVSKNLAIPISFLGVGEKPEDIVPFDPQKYVHELLGSGK